MKRDALRLSPHQYLETSRDINGRYWIAYSSGASVFIRDVAELRRFLKIPRGLAMRDSLDSWLASLADQDAQRKGAADPVIGDTQVEGSFDPLAHQDEDPTAATRMIT